MPTEIADNLTLREIQREFAPKRLNGPPASSFSQPHRADVLILERPERLCRDFPYLAASLMTLRFQSNMIAATYHSFGHHTDKVLYYFRRYHLSL
jgi:hypothetical protein